MADSGQEQSYVRSEGGRSAKEKEMLERAHKDGECPFCRIIRNQDDPTEQRIILRYGKWCAIENITPYEGTILSLVMFSTEHPESNLHRDLSLVAQSEHETAIAAITKAFSERLGIDLEQWGYSIVSRRGRDGTHNGRSVHHPSTQILVSDGLPVALEQIPQFFLELTSDDHDSICRVFAEHNPELAAKLEGVSHLELWLEALKFFRYNLGLLRSALSGKAVDIPQRISGRATEVA